MVSQRLLETSISSKKERLMTRVQYLAIIVLFGISLIVAGAIGGRMAVAQSGPAHSVKAPETSGGQKWEYRVVDVGYDKAETLSNTLGEQGFEMLNFEKSPYSKECTFVFKRLKTQ